MAGRHASTAYAALRRLVGVAALLGLFAMHGPIPHSSAQGGHVRDTAPAVAMAGNHATALSTDTTVDAPMMVSPRTNDTPDGALLGMAGIMCAAVLLIGFVITLRLARGIAIGRRADAPLWRDRRPARARRYRAPPWLVALSIQRC